MPIPIANLTRQYKSIKKEIDAAIQSVLTSGQFTLGGPVETFEKKIAKYVGTKDAVGVNSGTDALILALLALGVGDGDEVITTPYSFIATAEAIALVGATPVFVDIDPVTFNINAKHIAAAVTRRTRAIMPVHLFGQMADMGPIMRVAKKHGLAVIEDSAQAIGASQNKRKSGSVGTAGCFSLFPTKNLGAFGDGGFVSTNDPQVAYLVRNLRAHGSDVKYIHERIGFLSRLHSMQAAIVTAKLPHLAAWNKRRREIAAMYETAFKDLPQVRTPQTMKGNVHVFHQYVIRAEKRDALQKALAAEGVGSAIHFPFPIHLQKAFSFMKLKKGSFPHAELASRETLALPMYAELTDAEVKSVIATVKRFYKNA